MSHLTYQTDPSWAQTALRDIPSLLADHKVCEEKATLTAQSIIRKWAGKYPILEPEMKTLAREENAHGILVARKQTEFGSIAPPPRQHPYARALRDVVAQGGGTLLDLLLASSLIEARSCERFVLLAEASRGSSLAGFYEDFIAAEARHHAMFVRMAQECFGEKAALIRLRRLAVIEAKIVQALPRLSRIH